MDDDPVGVFVSQQVVPNHPAQPLQLLFFAVEAVSLGQQLLLLTVRQIRFLTLPGKCLDPEQPLPLLLLLDLQSVQRVFVPIGCLQQFIQMVSDLPHKFLGSLHRRKGFPLAGGLYRRKIRLLHHLVQNVAVEPPHLGGQLGFLIVPKGQAIEALEHIPRKIPHHRQLRGGGGLDLLQYRGTPPQLAVGFILHPQRF